MTALRDGRPLDVVTFGEALIALTPTVPGPLRHVPSFTKGVGGAELNVAIGLARLGHRAGWCGRLGADELGEEIVGKLRAEGVDVAGSVRDPRRPTGLYIKERRPFDRVRVHYYRSGSAASRLDGDDLDLDVLLAGRILHVSGITLALSDSAHAFTLELLAEAERRGVTISFDANVRRALIGDAEPLAVLGPGLEAAHLLFLSDEEADLLLDVRDPADADQLAAVARHLRAEVVVVHGAWGAVAVGDGQAASVAAHAVRVVDTVGAGDAFVAGFLAGRLRAWPVARALALANACGAAAVTVAGDADGMPWERDLLPLGGDRGVSVR